MARPKRAAVHDRAQAATARSGLVFVRSSPQALVVTEENEDPHVRNITRVRPSCTRGTHLSKMIRMFDKSSGGVWVCLSFNLAFGRLIQAPPSYNNMASRVPGGLASAELLVPATRLTPCGTSKKLPSISACLAWSARSSLSNRQDIIPKNLIGTSTLLVLG